MHFCYLSLIPSDGSFTTQGQKFFLYSRRRSPSPLRGENNLGLCKVVMCISWRTFKTCWFLVAICTQWSRFKESIAWPGHILMLVGENLQCLESIWAPKHAKLRAKLAPVLLCRNNTRRAPVMSKPSRQLHAEAWLLLVNGQQFGAGKSTEIMQDYETLVCTGSNKGNWSSRLQEGLFDQKPLSIWWKKGYITRLCMCWEGNWKLTPWNNRGCTGEVQAMNKP